MTRGRRGLRRLACLLSGVVFALAAPPVDAIAALWVGMTLLAVALGEDPTEEAPSAKPMKRASPSWREGSGRGLAFGAGANLVALAFVPAVVARFTPLSHAVGVLALVLLATFEGLRWAAAGLVARAASRAGVPRALAFAAGVYAGTFLPTVFPWSAAGGATPWPALIQSAEWIGERGVTFLMALTSGLVAEGLTHGRRASVRPLALAALLVIGMAGLGQARMAAIDARSDAAEHVRVALVQPSTEAAERWDPGRAPAIVARLHALTAEAETAGPSLTVWPEAAYPYPLEHDATQQPAGAWAPRMEGAAGPVLAGLILRTPADTFNSAAILTADGAVGDRQDKIHLLWFGETLPLADHSPWLRMAFGRAFGRGGPHDGQRGRSFGLTPGARVSLLRTGASGEIRAAVLNCFEDTLPEAGRDAARAGPNLLVNITNDAWFVDVRGPSGKGEGDGEDGTRRIASRESELHLRLAVLRAVETRRDLVRAVNLGVTSWVSASGRVVARYDRERPGSLLATPSLYGVETPTTMYARFGDGPLGAVLLAVSAAFIRWRRGRAPPPRRGPPTASLRPDD